MTPEALRMILADTCRRMGLDAKVEPEALADMDPNGDACGSIVTWCEGDLTRRVFADVDYVVALDANSREAGRRVVCRAQDVGAAFVIVVAECRLRGWPTAEPRPSYGDPLTRDDARYRSRLSENERIGFLEDEDERRQ